VLVYKYALMIGYLIISGAQIIFTRGVIHGKVSSDTNIDYYELR
jgi:hypothetical protein